MRGVVSLCTMPTLSEPYHDRCRLSIPLPPRGPAVSSRLSDYAHIAEIIGAAAVVISLIYVGIQVRDSAGASRSASVNAAILGVTDTPGMAGLAAKEELRQHRLRRVRR